MAISSNQSLFKSDYQILVANKNNSYSCAAGETLLAAMERANKRCIKVGCRCGGCGLCKIRIISGNYACKSMSKTQINEQDSHAGLALACRVIPSSDMTIESDLCEQRIISTDK
ncbi:2Fe-2S iron-sulfur cluster binding domain-containing protein [Dasania marina]|uniref:2Fe-2S iron-sulfur cluster binding domain-containing protein n=1 Tax=Dasania marina TaxID=471499 RepID=UPI00037BE2BE|nr:2Fe-2S iron-sulfur cluster binding domain-containing protein [Dasania marina]